MRTKLILFIALVLAASMAASAFGVEKKEKKGNQTVTKKNVSLEQKRPAAASELMKKYDDFVDNNKNGIDDRRENLKPKIDNTVKQTDNRATAPAKKPAPKSGPKKEKPKN